MPKKHPKDFRTLRQHFNAVADSAPVIYNFISEIRMERPDLKDKTFYVPSNGNTSTTVMVGDEIFKKAKEDRHEKELARELKILQLFKKKNVPFVPHLQFVSAHKSFFSMNKMPGVTLATVIEKMTPAEISTFASDFGRARAMIDRALGKSRLPLHERFNLNIKSQNTVTALKLWDKPYIAETIARMDPDLRDILVDYHDRQEKGRRSFCHVDMHKWNILVDPDTKRLTGFIDVSRSCQSAFPEVEFGNLYYQIKSSHDFIQDAYAAYCAEEGGINYKPTDLFAANLLDTIGFWHADSHKKEPEIVERGINNCLSAAKKARHRLPAQKTA